MISITLNLASTFIIAFTLSFVIQIIILVCYRTPIDYYEAHDYASIKLQSKVQVDTSTADYIKSQVKVLCWIETCPKYLRKKAIHIQRTWGKRCDKTVYVTTEADNHLEKELDLVVVNVTEGYKYLWSKTIHALNYIHDRYIDEYDWFFKADDDTYVIVENLRYLLLKHSPDDLLAFGCLLKHPSNDFLYNSGGAGYVLSRATVSKLTKHGFTNPKLCPVDTPKLPEDTAIGTCLHNLNVSLIDTRDKQGRMKFHIERPEFHLTTRKHHNFWFDQAYPHFYGLGFECCSHEPVSFHYVRPSKMYLYDALLYNVWPYGIKYKDMKLD